MRNPDGIYARRLIFEEFEQSNSVSGLVDFTRSDGRSVGGCLLAWAHHIARRRLASSHCIFRAEALLEEWRKEGSLEIC